jgi:hypothetical protein
LEEGNERKRREGKRKLKRSQRRGVEKRKKRRRRWNTSETVEV